MTCIECHSTATELTRGDSGRYEKRCFDCGKEWGPFTSNQSATTTTTTTHRETNTTTQPSVADFADTENTEENI